MPARLRKLIGAIVLLVFIPAYALYAMAAAATVLPGTSGWTQLGYYIVAGLLWVLPAGVVVTWMMKPARGR